MKHTCYIEESVVDNVISRRSEGETIEAWVDELGAEDKSMMKLYLRGAGFAELGRLCGMRPENIARRVKKVLTRIASAKFCEYHKDLFDTLELNTARYYFLRGLTVRQISKKLNQPYQKISAMLSTIKSKINLNI